MLVFDPMYFIFLAPAMIMAAWASMRVKSALAHASKFAPSSRMTGAEVAARVLQFNNLHHVRIEPTQGLLGDHYDPRKKVLRLTPEIFQGRTLAAVGVAAHEAGHALQDAYGYAPLKLRNGLVPMASFGGNFSFLILLAGFILGSQSWVLAGIVLFSVTVLFQLINLPVEYNASRRAREVLVQHGIVQPQELAAVSRVLNAAALTYVAATLSAILTLLYFLFRSGLLGGSRD